MSPFSLSVEAYAAQRDMKQRLLADPRAVLTASEITHLKKLGRFECAMRARGGWVLNGAWHADRTFRRFVTLGLAAETVFNGHKLRLTHLGETVVAELGRRRRPAP